MNRQLSKAFKILVVAATVLTITAAPSLQAFSFSYQFSHQTKCGCFCCQNEVQERSCPMKKMAAENNCPCSVKQQLPFNSKPIESANPNYFNIELASLAVTVIDFTDPLESYDFANIHFSIDAKKHPPLYLLNSSFLI